MNLVTDLGDVILHLIICDRCKAERTMQTVPEAHALGWELFEDEQRNPVWLCKPCIETCTDERRVDQPCS